MSAKTTILFLLLACQFAAAQISVTNSGGYVKIDNGINGLDLVVLFNKIDAGSQLVYTGSERIEWKYTIGGTDYNSTQKDISPDNNVLYTLNIAGKPSMHIFTIDYSLHPINWQALEIAPEQPDVCNTLLLNASASVPPLAYTDSTGQQHTLARTFTLNCTDASWNSSACTDSAATHTVSDIASPISVAAPKRSTTFALSGDNWASQLGITPDSITVDYTAVKTESHLTASVVEREYLNEKDRTSATGEIEGSGPLNVEVLSNTNPLDIVYYEWKVASVETPDNYQRYNDVNLNYTFEKTGEYTIKFAASSNTCEYTDSINVKVIESYIEAPNVFTPNGDGMNDEWRVAYKSIDRYSCIVQNRWGRTVFKSDNPGKGWDGTIGGRPAAMGTYYYVIIAYGTDTDIDGKQKRYKLSGDINLLR